MNEIKHRNIKKKSTHEQLSFEVAIRQFVTCALSLGRYLSTLGRVRRSFSMEPSKDAPFSCAKSINKQMLFRQTTKGMAFQSAEPRVTVLNMTATSRFFFINSPITDLDCPICAIVKEPTCTQKDHKEEEPRSQEFTTNLV